MSVVPLAFDTGNAVLPDIGSLSYNGVSFSSLFKTHISGKVVPDEARRTRKFLEWTLYAEGNVTADDLPDTDDIMDYLRQKLTAFAAPLIYEDKGFGKFNINAPGSSQSDVAWGPEPMLLEFSPLGNARAAFVRWQVTVRFSEYPQTRTVSSRSSLGQGPVLQFTWDYHMRYDEEGYSSYRINGTLEIPLTRLSVEDRAIRSTVEDFREKWLNIAVDLDTFRVTERSFDYSRDRRTAQFVMAYEELPPMGLPPGCSSARGTFSVRNTSGVLGGSSHAKLALMLWTCSLRCTYTVRGDQDQRVALLAFYSLLWFRMQQTRLGIIPNLKKNDVKNQQNIWGNIAQILRGAAAQGQAGAGVGAAAGDNAVLIWDFLFGQARPVVSPAGSSGGACIITDFGFDEGLYLDSKTVTFHASWWMVTSLQGLLAATGFKRWQPGTAGRKNNLWGQSMQNVVGWRSWQQNGLEKDADLIVDLGGGGPWGEES